jgi:protocatechuate 3,4-dioxygenase beta subunit
VLGVGIAVWLGVGQSPGSGAPTPEPRAPGAPVKRWNTALRAPTPPPGGSLRIQGWVRDVRGPVAGVQVSATRPMPGETLSELKCPVPPENILGPRKKDPRLPDCMEEVHSFVVDHVSARYGEAPLYAEATAGEDGSFVLEGLPEGTFTLWALSERGARRQPDVAAGTEGVELLLGEGLTATGTVTDEEGRPLPEVRLTFLTESHTRFFDTKTAADGTYRLGPLPSDRYALVAEKEGWLPTYLPSSVMSMSWLQGDVTLFRASQLTGQVLSAGAAAPGVEVRLTSLDRPDFEQQVVATDAEGRFVFESLGPGEYRLLATSEDRHAVEERELGGGDSPGAPEEVVLNLGEARYVEGTVQDTSRRPVAGASVALRPENEYVRAWKTVTDAQGHYRLGPVVPGSYVLDLSAPRYVDLENSPLELTADTGRVDLSLRPALPVAGVLVDEEGRPVPEIRLVLSHPAELPGEFDLPPDMAWSDEEGRFSMDAPLVGEWIISISDEKYLSQSVRVQAPAENLRVVLSGGATVESTLTDESGAPVEGARVILWSTRAQGMSERNEMTDERGIATLRGIKPGSYVLEATLDHKGVERRASKSLEARGSEQLQVALSFEEGWTLSGTVVDSEGQPLAGISVRATRPNEETPVWRRNARIYGNRTANDAFTGPDGRFTVKHLVGDVFEVSPWKEGFTFNVSRSVGGERGDDSILRVREGAAEVRLVLERQGHIRGRVVGPDGSPFPRFTVNGRTVSGATGAFAVPFEETGQERLELSAPGMASVLRTVQVRQGIDVDLGEVRMGEGRRVTGRVVDAETGAPVAEVRVQIIDTAPNGFGSSYESGLLKLTGEDGTFELAQVESRPLMLGVQHRDYLEARIPLGASAQTVPVTLDPGARVEVTLRDAQGRPLEGRVSLWSEEHTRLETVVVHEGKSIRRGIEPGLYLARARMSEPARFHAQWVRIPERGPVALSFTQRNQGATLKLRLESTEKPFDVLVLPESVTLPLNEDTFTQWRFAGVHVEPDRDGIRTFPHLPSGKAQLLIVSFPPRVRYHLEELELPETGVVERVVQPSWRPMPSK